MGNDDQHPDTLKAEGRTDDQNHETHKVKFEDDRDNRPLMEHFLSDACEVLTIGIPCVVAQGARFVQETTISIILGRKNTVLLAGVGVSNIWTSWMDYMIMGGANQVGTLCGMAYGAGNLPLVGTWLKIGLLFITFLFPPMILLRFYTTPVLEFLGVPSIVAQPAGLFTIYSGAGMLFELWYGVFRVYLVSQGIVKPDMWISIIFIFVASFLIWLAVEYFEAGIVGVGLGLSLKRVLRISTLVIYCQYKGLLTKTFPAWGCSDAFRGDRWKVLAPMAIPGMIGGVAESAQMSLSMLLAARLGPANSAAFDLTMNIEMIVGACVAGVASGIGSLMARNLGEGLAKRSLAVTKVGCILVYAFLIGLSVSLYMIFPAFARFATKDPIVQHKIMSIRFISSLGMLLLGGAFLQVELISKQGRPDIVFTWLPVCGWFIGLPLQFFLTPIMGIKGIWIGQAVGYSLAHFVLLYYLITSDWEKLAQEARERSEADENMPVPSEGVKMQ